MKTRSKTINAESEPDEVVKILSDAELVRYPDFAYFPPGYDNPCVSLNVISKDAGPLHISKVEFLNVDTGLLYEVAVNETVTPAYSDSFRGIRNLERYSTGVRLSGEDIYPKLYGASAIDMTVSYSIRDGSNGSRSFNLKPASVKQFILVQ